MGVRKNSHPRVTQRKQNINEKRLSYQETSFYFKFCSCCVLVPMSLSTFLNILSNNK